MKKYVNGGIYKIDLHGKSQAEFIGPHPCIIVRTLKEKEMYLVVPLTSYTQKKWNKTKRCGYGKRILSTGSIARIDKVAIVHDRQIISRWSDNDAFLLPTTEEFSEVSNKVIDYFAKSRTNAEREYSNYLNEVTKLEDYIKTSFVSKNETNFKIPSNMCTHITIEDLYKICGTLYPQQPILIQNNSGNFIVDIQDRKSVV